MKKRMLFILTTLMAIALTAPAIDPDAKWTMARRLYSDPKARQIGDILTVFIIESSSSSKEASSKTAKKTSTKGSLSVFHPRLDNSPTSWTNASIPEWGIEASRGFDGSGEQKNSDQITATLSARVMEVLPNGNLLIEGKRTLAVQSEEMEYVLTGTVRPIDISRENTIYSTKIADLSIQYLSSGSVAKSQQKGVFDKVVDFINPF